MDEEDRWINVLFKRGWMEVEWKVESGKWVGRREGVERVEEHGNLLICFNGL
jgi:hypothetical protein